MGSLRGGSWGIDQWVVVRTGTGMHCWRKEARKKGNYRREKKKERNKNPQENSQ